MQLLSYREEPQIEILTRLPPDLTGALTIHIATSADLMSVTELNMLFSFRDRRVIII
jgi:hypothetical protein